MKKSEMIYCAGKLNLHQVRASIKKEAIFQCNFFTQTIYIYIVYTTSSTERANESFFRDFFTQFITAISLIARRFLKLFVPRGVAAALD